MKLTKTIIDGCLVLEPEIFKDNRGVFYETYNKKVFELAVGHELNFVQDNHSVSKKGVLRGLHFQTGRFAQAKLVRVTKGEALDVVVDIRKDSSTFGKHIKMKLTEDNNKILFIPKGLAHGFLSLSKKTIFSYKCDAFYNKLSESGISYDDEDLGIDWEYPIDRISLSQKDKELPRLKELYP